MLGSFWSEIQIVSSVHITSFSVLALEKMYQPLLYTIKCDFSSTFVGNFSFWKKPFNLKFFYCNHTLDTLCSSHIFFVLWTFNNFPAERNTFWSMSLVEGLNMYIHVHKHPYTYFYLHNLIISHLCFLVTFHRSLRCNSLDLWPHTLHIFWPISYVNIVLISCNASQ